MQTPYVKFKVPKRKRIALIAHDDTKTELFAWLYKHIDIIKNHELCGTGTTSTIIRENFDLEIKSYLSGPLGGDQQIGAAIANGEIDIMFFFWDPMSSQPHDPDVKALLRMAVIYDVATAQSPTDADFLVTSPMMDKEFYKYIPNTKINLKERVKKLD